MYDNIEGIEQAVGQVETAVQEAAQSINQSIRENSAVLILKPFFWGALIVWTFMSLSGIVWHSKLRYALQYDTGVREVNVATKPHDCEFWAAPLGNKYCHYERRISTLRWATSTDGQPIVSYDEGKIWNTYRPDNGVTVQITPGNGVTVQKNSTVENVYVAWEKKEDD